MDVEKRYDSDVIAAYITSRRNVTWHEWKRPIGVSHSPSMLTAILFGVNPFPSHLV